MPAGSTTRGPVFHTLDISELYVRLLTSSRAQHLHVEADSADSQLTSSQEDDYIVFDREPWCHIKIGHVEVKPDAFLKFNEREQYFIEVDRASADRTKLSKKLRQSVNLYESWDVDLDGETFPQCIYTVPDTDRKRQVESVIRSQRYPLFRCMLFSHAVERLIR